MVQNISGIRCDFVASFLRLQVDRLREVLNMMENEEVDCGQMRDSIRDVECELRQIRKDYLC